ncbi:MULTISPECIES: cysteine hydrolase family protein [Cryobacterium]|uniref:cysteine hydrolase family protein n=1 Tax=Cryobacterium TaxID=69578 RepID=UPI0018E07F51|nr:MULTISPECIES: cysteine hydrolase family protein [Cryobacterium]MDY7527331.1 cysteine hydrolase family protein [Cryobacterium sp. 10C2]MDY7556884.1 cysteine hydrolase family protein [Cryobacterium sp. 10C3]MEB0004923.1 cysteine hydrolase family protein [Cryobacterium sp. RTC2.1]MEB0203786.1 cysteine hydrolase family protein [Cryobacterium sp. 5I3]MEB0287395.1 cysteine hydrolase family protein [Cryobacterium sp. 10S3]
MSTGIVVIDIQKDYFPGGAYPLSGSESAAVVARGVLDSARATGTTVIHFQHIATEADATFFVPGTTGVEIYPLVAPVTPERHFTKGSANAFVDTGLERLLRAENIDHLVVMGMMSSMCIDATSRAALDLGFAVTIVHNACAAPAFEFQGTEVPGASVHAAFMAALRDAGADVLAAADLDLESLPVR